MQIGTKMDPKDNFVLNCGVCFANL